jgi:hypothetical protein
MEKLPEIHNSWGDLCDLARIGTQSTVFLKAIEWKIFDYVTAAVPAGSVAANMKSHPRNTELFLNSLAGMGLIVKENGLFRNTEKSDEFLVSTSPTYLGGFFLHVAEWSSSLEQNMELMIEVFISWMMVWVLRPSPTWEFMIGYPDTMHGKLPRGDLGLAFGEKAGQGQKGLKISRD